MAKIKGIQLKAIRDFMGEEGYGFTANMYFNNKKIGEVVDHADGSGEFNIHIQDKSIRDEIAKLSKQYYEENPKSFLYYSENACEDGQKEGIISETIEELKELDFIEKAFKKYTKQGFPITIAIDFNERTQNIHEPDYNFDNLHVIGVKVWNDAMKKKLQEQFPKAKVFQPYKSLDDFIKQ